MCWSHHQAASSHPRPLLRSRASSRLFSHQWGWALLLPAFQSWGKEALGAGETWQQARPGPESTVDAVPLSRSRAWMQHLRTTGADEGQGQGTQRPVEAGPLPRGLALVAQGPGGGLSPGGTGRAGLCRRGPAWHRAREGGPVPTPLPCPAPSHLGASQPRPHGGTGPDENAHHLGARAPLLGGRGHGTGLSEFSARGTSLSQGWTQTVPLAALLPL